MSGEQAPIMTRKMETIISRPAFGRASTNQRKKKETKRKLGVVRLIKDCVVLESPPSLFKIANCYSLTRASASISISLEKGVNITQLRGFVCLPTRLSFLCC